MQMRWTSWLALAVVLAGALAGCGRAPAPALGDGVIKSADVATQSGAFQAPRDSALDPDATTIYFTAAGAQGPAVFRVPAGGGEALALASGAPLVEPVGIAISADASRLYVADPGAGQIFTLPVGGGAPAALVGSHGSAPRGLAVAGAAGQELLYFTGVDPSDGQPAVMKLPAGGAASVVAKGAPLVAPDGITVTEAGVLYVSDRSAGGNGLGAIFKIEGGAVSTVVKQVRVGDPAGVALTRDDRVLLVSALQPDRDSDQVLLVDLTTLATGSVTQGIAQNQRAGGVHRARNSNVFSWADLAAGGGGRVYRIELK